MSQADLAARIGKPPTFVGKYELGEKRLETIELIIILRELNSEFNTLWICTNAHLPKEL
ncbi:helix-turn-helix domain-containing protein [Aliiroseovarius sp. 2305UL8-7]|uniref:helix-turn-helix domain-containing protein n=1 Tax=Aliiroseovarius conchicola TaxID=3121637 RepID=UPI003528BAA2